MWGKIKHCETNCPNCGNKDWEDETKDFECPQCGYHKVEMNELPAGQMMFCEGCGCHYSDGCSVHDASKQRPVK